MRGNFEAVESRTDGYDLDDVIPIPGTSTVPEGTSLLVSGPAMLGKRRLALSLVGQAEAHGEPVVLISPARSGDRVLQEYRQQNGTSEDVYLVDCSGTGDRSSFEDTRREYYVSGPDDLTGIGIALVKSTRAMERDAENGVRVALLSVSTLLQYTSVDRVFNFLHVMRNRFAAAGYLGVATFDPTLHDDRVANAVLSLFDAVLDLREADDGHREVRARGIAGAPRTWHHL